MRMRDLPYVDMQFPLLEMDRIFPHHGSWAWNEKKTVAYCVETDRFWRLEEGHWFPLVNSHG